MNYKKSVKIILATLIIVLVSIWVFTYSKKTQSTGPQLTNIFIPSQDTTPTKTPPPQIVTPIVNTGRLTDKANLYSITIPKEWKITASEGAMGVQLSSIIGESPDWTGRTDETAEGPCRPVYFDSGVHFQFHVTNEEESNSHFYAEGGGVISQKDILIDGVHGVYHVFKEPCTDAGQLVDAHVNHKGNTYLFRFAYNPEKLPQAETLFMEILNSVTFTK